MLRQSSSGPKFFTREDLIRFGAKCQPSVRPEVASRAFGMLENNASALGLRVVCSLRTCYGRRCPGPHRIWANGFRGCQYWDFVAADGGGPALAGILVAFRELIYEGRG